LVVSLLCLCMRYRVDSSNNSINRTSKKYGFLDPLRAARSGAGYVKR
jgi:hypothetical protein